MNPTKLDHVAYWVADRDPVAEFVTTYLGMHVIDRTETFTLVGSNARRGKLTLFDADGPRERGALEHVALRVSNLEAALDELPSGLEVDRPRPGEAYFDVGAEGLRLGLVEADTDVEFDLDHVALRSKSPEETAGEYASLGFAPAAPGPSGAPRLDGAVELRDLAAPRVGRLPCRVSGRRRAVATFDLGAPRRRARVARVAGCGAGLARHGESPHDRATLRSAGADGVARRRRGARVAAPRRCRAAARRFDRRFPAAARRVEGPSVAGESLE